MHTLRSCLAPIENFLLHKNFCANSKGIFIASLHRVFLLMAHGLEPFIGSQKYLKERFWGEEKMSVN